MKIDVSPEKLDKMITPIEKVYAVVDHTRCLAYMLGDCIVPSNVREGYLARLVIRRTLRMMNELKIQEPLADLIEQQTAIIGSRKFEQDITVVREIVERETEKYALTLERGTRIAQSALLPRSVWLPKLVPSTLLNAGAIIAIVMAVLVYIFLWRTTIGYRIRAVGLNPNAARYAGIRVPVYQALALTLGGAFAGLAGAIEVMGIQHRALEGLSGGYGFSGIVVALFGWLHPLGAIPASILFGGLLVGADAMQRTVQVLKAVGIANPDQRGVAWYRRTNPISVRQSRAAALLTAYTGAA